MTFNHRRFGISEASSKAVSLARVIVPSSLLHKCPKSLGLGHEDSEFVPPLGMIKWTMVVVGSRHLFQCSGIAVKLFPVSSPAKHIVSEPLFSSDMF